MRINWRRGLESQVDSVAMGGTGGEGDWDLGKGVEEDVWFD